MELQRSNTPQLRRSDAPTLRSSDAPKLQRSDAPKLQRSDAPTLRSSDAPTLRRSAPASSAAFLTDRTAREVVALNLLVALQETIGLATHWIADDGVAVPNTYGDLFSILADRGVIDSDLGRRLRAAAGLRNLVADQYGALDFARVHALVRTGLDDLLTFCHQLSARVAPASGA